ncbi:hypothetical protein [Proteus phage VTCCBPA139]|nr:hypothetical protein [Proteus phage VTCCBPA139]
MEFVLKLVRSFSDEEAKLNTAVEGQYRIFETTKYIPLGSRPEILKGRSITGIENVSAVIRTGDGDIVIYREVSAYLLNEEGKTIQIINRP